jgi:RNA polymerase sigma factor (TIGR02999 family)
MPDATEITQLLVRAREGDGKAKDLLFPAVYRDLEAIAKAQVRSGASLEPRGLVHELFLRLSGASIDAIDRKHFFAIAALAMRQILVDRARKKQSAKRGGKHAERVTLSGLASDEGSVDLVAVDAALRKREALSARQARIVELRCLLGMTVEETAETIGVSERTVHAEWRLARAWLTRELSAGDGDAG